MCNLILFNDYVAVIFNMGIHGALELALFGVCHQSYTGASRSEAGTCAYSSHCYYIPPQIDR
jgi:hypothetical protein